MTCSDCLWFVDDVKGEYSHTDAVKNKRGFCVMRELFTKRNPDDDVCSDFYSDGEKDDKCR